jgi:hypothetical protein
MPALQGVLPKCQKGKKRFKLQTGDSGNPGKTERSDVAATEDGRSPGLGQHFLQAADVLWSRNPGRLPWAEG